MAATFITFNVAGLRFTTTKETVLKEPASRLSLLVRGVLPCVKDDAGAIFLDRDGKYFQLLLNWLRDGWCTVPVTAQERRELLQEVRYFQLSSMEAWLKAQEVAISLNEASLLPRPSSAPIDPYNRSSLLSPALNPLAPAPALSTAALSQGHSLTTAVAGYANPGSSSSSPSGSPFRGSFLAGVNQDLLAAGALASCGLINSSTSRPSSAAAGGLGLLGGKASLVGGAAMGLGEGANGAAGLVGAYSIGAGSQAAASGLPRIPLPLPSDGFKWTSRLLQTNPKMQELINTLLELAHLPPHSSLHAGKVTISCSSECTHDLAAAGRTSMLLLSAQQQLEAARFRNQVIRVDSSLGWAFELAVRPSSDVPLHDKYNMADFLQDNWFMVTAVLKEQYGILMEEDLAARPHCLACRRHNITLTLQRIY